MLIASKSLQDTGACILFKRLAHLLQLSRADLTRLEFKFLAAMDFQAYVSETAYNSYCNSLDEQFPVLASASNPSTPTSPAATTSSSSNEEEHERSKS